MEIITILIFMVFAHIVDDFYLQGILAQLKQKGWWKAVQPQELYKYDYIIALIMHSISWSVMIMLPIFIAVDFDIHWFMYLVFLTNVVVHAVTDHMKCNRLKISLLQDQLIHLTQIVYTCVLFLFTC